MNDKKYILIGTTATNRSELHKEIIPEWVNYFNELDKSKYELKWFINIDFVKRLKEPLDITYDNFKKIIKNIDTEYIINNKTQGNFLNACKNVSIKIKKFINNNKLISDNVYIFWLEDDWML